MRLTFLMAVVAFSSPHARAGCVMTDSSIRTAVAAWLSGDTATYGHISTWETGGVTDMNNLFCGYECDGSSWCSDCNSAAASFNEDISAWDTSGVTTMNAMFKGASDFNQDISGWAVHSVTDMSWMFGWASAFDQDLGWCVDYGVSLNYAFFSSPCESTSCGILNTATLRCGGAPMSDSSIRTAVNAWLSNPAAAEATYGHISTWETGEVTDMNYLFGAQYWQPSVSFNDDIGAWDTSSVTTMEDMFADSTFNRPIGGWSIEAVTSMKEMFEGASAFDQDLGWCVENDAILTRAFEGTACESTSCGVAQKDVLGICEPWSRPCLIGKANHSRCKLNSPSLAIFIGIALLLCCCCCCYLCCRKKKEPSSTTSSRPDSPAESPRKEPDEEATAEEATAEKTEVEESVEPSSFSKLTSFLFGEREEAPKEEEEAATLPVVAEADEEATEQPPPPPARSWFSSAEPEPVSAEETLPVAEAEEPTSTEQPPPPAQRWFSEAEPEA